MDYPTYLFHYGIEGQKWGVRRFQNEDGTWTQEGLERRKELTKYGQFGGTIKKGTELYRVAIRNPRDPTYNNKKYVSTSELDHAKWEDYLVDAYKKYGDTVYDVRYETIKDIEVASTFELGNRVMKEYEKDPEIINRTLSEIQKFFPSAKTEELEDPSTFGSYSMAAQTNFGNKLINDLLKSGYGAVVDRHGWNTAYDPLIILDPDNKIRMTKIKQY